MDFDIIAKDYKIKRVNNTLILELELDKVGKLAKTEKSMVIFTTGGFIRLPGDDNAKISINVIKPKPEGKVKPPIPPF
jgi:hypothetical protein